MKKGFRPWFAALLVGFSLFAQTNPSVGQTYLTQICLGWTGGAAGNGYKWVSGNITWNGNIATITYDWAGIGTMNGVLQNGVLRGDWQQIGSNGGFYFSLPAGNQHTALGQWWNAKSPQTRHGMTVTTQMSHCS